MCSDGRFEWDVCTVNSDRPIASHRTQANEGTRFRQRRMASNGISSGLFVCLRGAARLFVLLLTATRSGSCGFLASRWRLHSYCSYIRQCKRLKFCVALCLSHRSLLILFDPTISETNNYCTNLNLDSPNIESNPNINL